MNAKTSTLHRAYPAIFFLLFLLSVTAATFVAG